MPACADVSRAAGGELRAHRGQFLRSTREGGGVPTDRRHRPGQVLDRAVELSGHLSYLVVRGHDDADGEVAVGDGRQRLRDAAHRGDDRTGQEPRHRDERDAGTDTEQEGDRRDGPPDDDRRHEQTEAEGREQAELSGDGQAAEPAEGTADDGVGNGNGHGGCLLQIPARIPRRSSLSRMTSRVNGFMTYSLAPAARAFTIWPDSLSVVTMTIGM